MTTLIATYENGVLRLPHRLDLPEHSQVKIHIEPAPQMAIKESGTILRQLLSLSTDLGVADLAEQHDHYLYGIKKR